MLGGGVAGMTAAHELAEREFEVTVLEARPIAGGKARSMPVPGSGTGGRRDLPGEHGFRFFPGFYRHLPDTMRRIPFADERDGVLSNLVPATRVQIARAGGAEIITASSPPGLARRAGPRLSGAVRLRHRTRDLAGRVGVLRGSTAPVADLLRGSALRRVRAPELVGVLRGADAVGRLRQVPGRRADAHPGRREGPGDERPHRRLHPAAAPVRPLPARWPGRSRAEGADERRLDRPVARAPALAGGRLPAWAPGAGDPLRRRADQRRRRGRR